MLSVENSQVSQEATNTTSYCKAKMILFYVIITTLPMTALAKETYDCNSLEPPGPQLCFGKLGEPLIFYLPNSPKIKRLKIYNNSDHVILHVINTTVVHTDNKSNKLSGLFINGTFKLSNATKKDSGEYKLETFGHDGTSLHKINFHLEIQAPVSQPAVSQSCLSLEQMEVSCSSEGDGVEFTLSLDNNILIQTRPGSTDELYTPKVSNVTMSLHGQRTGNLKCQVRNNVSGGDTILHLTSCTGSIYHPSLVTVVMAASVSTLLLHLALFLCSRFLRKKTVPVTVNEDNVEEEIVYSDIRVKTTGKTRPTHKNAT